MMCSNMGSPAFRKKVPRNCLLTTNWQFSCTYSMTFLHSCKNMHFSSKDTDYCTTGRLVGSSAADRPHARLPPLLARTSPPARMLLQPPPPSPLPTCSPPRPIRLLFHPASSAKASAVTRIRRGFLGYLLRPPASACLHRLCGLSCLLRCCLFFASLFPPSTQLLCPPAWPSAPYSPFPPVRAPIPFACSP